MTQKHSLIRPVSPAAIINARMLKLGQTVKETARRAGMKPRRLRRILRGARIRWRDVACLAIGLDRWHVSLQVEFDMALKSCAEWDRREAAIAKERGL